MERPFWEKKRWQIAIGLPVVLYLLYTIFLPSYTWHQKLTITVETPNGEVSGSNVVWVRVARKIRILGEGGSRSFDYRGEAAVLHLGNGKLLFALISEGNIWRIAQGTFLKFDAKYYRSPDVGFASYIDGWPTREEVPSKHYPMFVTFEDINDPKTVKRVRPGEFEKVFGEGYELKSVTLEITNEPVTDGEVEGVLGWITTAEFIIPPELQPRLVKDQTPEQKLLPRNFIDWRTLKKKREGKD